MFKSRRALISLSKSRLSHETAGYASRPVTYQFEQYKTLNEAIYDYKKDSAEREKLSSTLKSMLRQVSQNGDSRDGLHDVPIVIGDKEYRTGHVRYQLVPFDHSIKLARFYYADKKLINEAIESGLAARAAWENSSVEYRSSILLRLADKLAINKRDEILAATMLGQGKTVYQAGI